MPKTIYAMDHEFEKWCEERLVDGKVTSIEYLQMLHEGYVIWEAATRRCADLCVQNGLKGMGMTIMKREDGSVDESWMESHRDGKE